MKTVDEGKGSCLLAKRAGPDGCGALDSLTSPGPALCFVLFFFAGSGLFLEILGGVLLIPRSADEW